MKILIVNRFFHPDESATSRMAASLVRGLADRGYDVHVIASRQRHDGPETYDKSDRYHGATVHRVWTSRFGRERLLGRALDYLTFHLSVAFRIRRMVEPGDVVVACTDPPLVSVTAMLGMAGTGAHLVNWLHDLFPEAAIQLGLVRERSWLTKVFLSLRDLSLRRAGRNVTPIPRMADYLAGRGVDRDTFKVIRQWSNGAEIFPVERETNALRAEWGLRDKTVIGYSGNLGRVHEFGTILDAAERLKERSDIVFLFIGDGQRRAWLEAEVRRRQLGNVMMKPLQPAARLAESLGAVDVHLVSLLPALEFCSIPSKFYGILAAGRPTLFVGDSKGEIAVTIRETGCGGAVAIGEDAALAGLIERLAASPEERVAMGERARRTFEVAYTEDAAMRAWTDLIEGLRDRAAGRQPETAGALEPPVGRPSVT